MENNFFQQNNDIFQMDELNKENSIQKEISKYDFSSIETVYSLLDEYANLKEDSTLQIIKNKLNNERFNIKGSLEHFNINIQPYDNINETNNYYNLFEIEIILSKIYLKNNKYLSSIDKNEEEEKNNNK